MPTDFVEALAGQYVVEREIGRGGMGIVYLAQDVTLQRPVAIKTLLPHLADDPAVRERFLREARTAAALRHPGIVPVYGADELSGHVFFVMPYIEGVSLAMRIRGSTAGRLGGAEVVRRLMDVAAALAHAHGKGVIHRDVKAENILIDRSRDVALVTDFGIACLTEATPMTASGQILGTVYYLSPEQIRGAALDGRSDLYALGVVGYYALSGRFPFDGPTATAVIAGHIEGTLSPVAIMAPGVPPRVAAIIERCLAKRADDRYANCAELVEALADVLPSLGDTTGAPELSNGRAALAPKGPMLVSDTEVSEILGRAAELDDLTEGRPRPAIVPRPRDQARDRARREGLGPDKVRDAAREAGIGPRNIDQALAEHGLGEVPGEGEAGTRVTVGEAHVVPGPGESRFWAAVRGGPIRTTSVVRLAGEMSERDFGSLVRILRREAGAGAPEVVGRELTWQSGLETRRVVRAEVSVEDGVTAIEVEESLVGRVNWMRLAMGIGLFCFLLAGMRRSPVTIAFAGALYGGLAVGLRLWFGRLSQTREEKQRQLMDALVERAGQGIGLVRSGARDKGR